MAEHYRQQETLHFMEMIIELISFKVRFVYPQTVFFSQNDFQELLESCGLDKEFHVVYEGIDEYPIEEIHNYMQHIWTNSDKSFVVLTEYDPFSYYKEDAFAGVIVIKGDFRSVTQFNTLLYDHAKEFRPIDDELRCGAFMPLKDEWLLGRFFKK